jgi:hypothetical protein
MNVKELDNASYIESLKEQILKLEQENASLKALLKKENTGLTNEHIICQVQIHRLKDYALTRDLNADETRKLATYVDILEKIKDKVISPEEAAVKEMTVEDLTSLIN